MKNEMRLISELTTLRFFNLCFALIQVPDCWLLFVLCGLAGVLLSSEM